MAASRLLRRDVPSITVTDVDKDGGELHGMGATVDAFACGRQFVFAPICEEENPDDIDDSRFGYLSLPFVVVGRQRFRARCEPGRGADALIRAFSDAAEHQFGDVLWFGDPNWVDGSGGTEVNLLYLTSGDVATTAILAGEDAKHNVAVVLADAFEAHPDLDPVLHLGMHTAMTIGTDGLGALGYPYVVNPAYPINGVAVTGPIRIFIGTVQNLTHVDWPVNRRYAEGTRLGRIEFDPCLARMGVAT